MSNIGQAKIRRPYKTCLLCVLLSLVILLPGFRQIRQTNQDRALLLAIENQDTGRAITLLDQGADANAGYSRGIRFGSPPEMFRDCLSLLCQDQSSTSQTLLQVYRDVSWDSGFGSRVPPENAVLVKALLDRGADPNVSNHFTPLQSAVMSHHVSTARLLIRHGARSDLSTLLRSAVSQNDPAMASMLMDEGANPNAMDSRGEDAIAYVSKRPARNYDVIPGSRKAILLVLQQHGARILKMEQD